MRVGVVQSSYVPWRGYFDLIRSVDLFVVYDDVMYSKGSWRNRNQIKTRRGREWLTVPVHASIHRQIQHTSIDESTDWRKRHMERFRTAYLDATYVNDALHLFDDGLAARCETISALNVRLIQSICEYLKITTPLILSRDFHLSGAKTERLIQLLRAVGAKTYLSGPSARAYLEEERFRDAGISLEYKSYDYKPYPQQWGAFDGGVTVLDLIANCGPEAATFLVSTQPNAVAV